MCSANGGLKSVDKAGYRIPRKTDTDRLGGWLMKGVRCSSGSLSVHV